MTKNEKTWNFVEKNIIDLYFETFIVLEVPSPIKEQIMAIRKAHRDVFRISLPIEITITGSSGVGAFEVNQNPSVIFNILDDIAAQTSPIQNSFGEVLRFPNTDIFVLTLADETPLMELHKKIISSNIRFRTSPFPYKPHCTLRGRWGFPVSDEEAETLLAIEIPGSFTLDLMSVYLMNKIPLTLLHQVRLKKTS